MPPRSPLDLAFDRLRDHPLLGYNSRVRSDSPKSILVPQLTALVHVHVGEAIPGAARVVQADSSCVRWLHLQNRYVFIT